jgi:hypothetical protein
MSIITGKIQEIYQGTVKSGRSQGSPFWTITLDSGNKLSTFTPEHVTTLVKGGEYTFDIEKKGDYINIMDVPAPCIQRGVDTIPDEDPAETTHLREPTRVSPDLPNVTSSEGSERTYKNRISALQAAVTHAGGIATADDIIVMAIRFEGYIENGK